MLALEAAFRPDRADGVQCTIELTLSGFRFHVVIDSGTARCIAGAATNPDASANTTTDTLIAIGDGHLSVGDAIDQGDLQLHGSRRDFRQLFRLFDLSDD